MEYDFGGYVTKNDLLCADGRTIRKNAFKGQNGMKVPLVWMHQRNDPDNVLGHAILENRDDGVYGYCKFNSSPKAKKAKLLVEHGDINAMSIYANQLNQKGGNVTHGLIREVSLVIAGANPGALIDNPVIQHSDDDDQDYEDMTQAIIHSGCEISLDDVEYEPEVEHAVKAKKKPKEEPVEEEEDEEDEEDDSDDIDTNADETDDIDDENNEEGEPVNDKKKKLQHADEPDTKKKQTTENDSDNEETVQDVYDSMTEKQKKVVAYMIGAALSEQEAEHSDMEGDYDMPRNVFDQNDYLEMNDNTPSLSHDQISAIFEDAKKCGSLKESCLQHAQEYGIENIDVLFPDAKAVANEPYMVQRDMEWVASVLSETKHVPFANIKSTVADITADEARAKGYVKGKMKKEEVIKLLKRVTTPTTIYKKQKLDRDDILDITDFVVVAWLKAEMRVMLNEEIARAVLVSDGREVDAEDKIDEDHIRPIYKDDDMYAHHIYLPSDMTDEEIPEQILLAQEEYKGSGSPTLYTTSGTQLKMLLLKDKIGRRLYNTSAELASAIDVSKIVKVPVMENQTREVEGKTYKLIAILVNLRDYVIGTNAGGEINSFDDFDIDYNQYKYLMETRMSGALVMPKSAVVIEQEVGTSTVAYSARTTTSDIG